MKPRCETTDTEATSDRQSPVEEISVNSSHRGEHNLVCLKCLQLRTGSSSSAEDSTNNSVCECFKVTNCTRIRDYLEKGKDENYFEEFMLPKKVLSKLALVLDIVTLQSERSCCFTKAYGHYAEGTGSVLKMADVDVRFPLRGSSINEVTICF